MSKNKDKTSQSLEGALDNEKKAKKSQLTHKSAFVDISDEVTDNFKYGDQGKVAESLNAAMGNEEYLAVQRDFMTVMSNSMSASDFQKMKEEGFDVSKMEPEQAVTILDKIKTVLAQSGTSIAGYNDNLSVEKITEITGNSGYAETIAKELSYADVPVTEETIKQMDEVVDQALTMEAPKEGSLAYMISRKMEPTLFNLYKAEHSSISVSRPQNKMTGYASNVYSKQGTDTKEVRKTMISEEDYQQIEKQIKNRIINDGLEVNAQNIENGKWLLEKGLPVTGENISLLQDIKDVSFPLNMKKVIKQAAQALGEGKSPFDVNLNKVDDGIYKEAYKIYNRYQKVSYQAVDYTVNNNLECNLENLESYNPSFGHTVPQLQARKVLEEVRLKMTVEANMKLLKSGFRLETAPMEELITRLEEAAKDLNASVWGKEDTENKAKMFSQTQEYVKELPRLPVLVIGKIPFMEKATLQNVVQEGRALQQQFDGAKDSYETIMTVPRQDLGDSIQKAFRNVDHILQSMDLEPNEANRRAVRIMGYNRIAITEDNLAKVKEADRQVQTIIEKMKPGMTLEMIREGKNPLQMSMEELEHFILERENDFLNDTEKYSEFLYKLEKKNQITEAEKEAYIGVYRLFRQIEKSDGALIGSLINQNAEINFSNLLSALRTKKAKNTDVKIDDSTKTVVKINKKGTSISEQIENNIISIQKNMTSENGEKTPDQILEEIHNLQKDQKLEKELLKNQLEDMREISKQSIKEKEYLEMYHQPVTLDNMQSSMLLNRKRGNTFKKTIEMEEKLSKEEITRLEKGILEEAEEFLSSMEKEESRENSYEEMISHMKQVLEETVEQKSLGYIDVKEIQSLYKQVSLAGNLSREENYEIPVQFEDGITSINLKIIQGTAGKREVKITFETETLGHVEARFTETDYGLEGSVLTDYMDGKTLLQNHAQELQKALTEALKDTKTELKSMFFGVNEKLDINFVDYKEREKNIDVSLLYKVAKEFIYYVKGIKEA